MLTLTEEQKTNIEYIIKRMGQMGLTNPFIQAGILAVISKESSFKPKSERAYSGTSNSRIRAIFGSRVSGMTDEQLTDLKNNPERFFDKIYGGRYGNALNEGYKYRGRGFNQLTFKANYENINKYTTKDIVADPDSVNELATATEAVIGFFERAFSRPNAKVTQYNMANVNEAKNTLDAVRVAYHANTGWGKSKSKIESEPTGGYKKALDRVDQFYEYTKDRTSPPVIDAKETSQNSLPDNKILETGIVTAGVLNIRKGPGTTFDKNGSFKAGDFLNVYEKNGRWLKISATEDKWVHGNYVDESDPTGAPVATPILDTGKVTANVLNIRKGPDTTFDKDGSLKRGDIVNVYVKKGRWLKISATEEKWVHGNYVDE